MVEPRLPTSLPLYTKHHSRQRRRIGNVENLWYNVLYWTRCSSRPVSRQLRQNMEHAENFGGVDDSYGIYYQPGKFRKPRFPSLTFRRKVPVSHLD